MKKILPFFFLSLYIAAFLYSEKIFPLYLKELIFLSVLHALANLTLAKKLNIPEILKSSYLGSKYLTRAKHKNEILLIYALIESQVKIYLPFFIIAFMFQSKVITYAVIVSAFILLTAKISALLKITKKISIIYVLWIYALTIIKNALEIYAYVLSIIGNLPTINAITTAFLISLILPIAELLPFKGIGLKELIMALILGYYYGNFKYFLFAFTLTTALIYGFNFLAHLLFHNKKDNA